MGRASRVRTDRRSHSHATAVDLRHSHHLRSHHPLRLGAAVSARPRRFYRWQVWVDLLLETAIVQSTGGLDSGFVFLYILSIIAASTALPSRSIFSIAASASVLYSFLVYLDFHAIIHPLPSPFTLRTEVIPSGSYVLYATLLRMTAFWVVALLSRYLAESLRQTGQVVQEQRARLIGLHAFHENVVNSMNSGLLITDMSGQVVSSNHAAERILQLPLGGRQGWLAQEVLNFIKLDEIAMKSETFEQGLNRFEGLLQAHRWKGDHVRRLLISPLSRCDRDNARD